MPDTARPRPHRGLPRLTLNTDGRPHPVENTLTAVTLVCGLAAFVTGWFVDLHIFASTMGLVGFVGGLYAQYVSATTAQRCLIVVGIVAAFVGGGIAIAHGGFVP